MTKGKSRLKFYNRIRSTLLSLKTNSDSRIITDLSMVSPLANDKGTPVMENLSGKKRSLKQERSSKVKRSGKGSRPVKF